MVPLVFLVQLLVEQPFLLVQRVVSSARTPASEGVGPSPCPCLRMAWH